MTLALLSTKQAAKLLQVSPSTVIRWADEEVLRATRTAGGHRRFERSEIERVKNLSREQVAEDPSQAWLDLAMQMLGPPRLQVALLSARSEFGSWWMVADKLGLAITELGETWEDGRCSIIEEHLVTGQMERAIAVCTMSIELPTRPRNCLLATAEGDIHTLGLLLVDLCLREAGWMGNWVGTNTPTTELVEFIRSRPVDMVCLSASSWFDDSREIQRQYQAVADACSETGSDLVLGGMGAWPNNPDYGARLRKFHEFHSFLSRSHIASPTSGKN